MKLNIASLLNRWSIFDYSDLTTEYFIIKVSYVSTITCLWNLSHKYIILMVHWPFVLHLSRKWSGKQYCLLVSASCQYVLESNIKCDVCTVNIADTTGCDYSVMDILCLDRSDTTCCCLLTFTYILYHVKESFLS